MENAENALLRLPKVYSINPRFEEFSSSFGLVGLGGGGEITRPCARDSACFGFVLRRLLFRVFRCVLIGFRAVVARSFNELGITFVKTFFSFDFLTSPSPCRSVLYVSIILLIVICDHFQNQSYL